MSLLKSSVLWLWRALHEHSEPIKIISGLAVGVFVLIEYLDGQATSRTNRALEYVKVYHSNEMREARFNNDPSILHMADEGYVLQQLRERRTPKQGEVLELDPTLVPKKDQADVQEMELSLSDSDNVVKQLQYMNTLKNFYRPVSYCAFSGLCDPDVICKNFFLDIQTFSARYPLLFGDLGEDWIKSELYFMARFLEFCQSDARFLTLDQ